MKSPIKVAIIEDHPEYREMVRLLLEDEEGISVGWEYGSAQWLLRRLENAKTEAKPDVILLDLGLPGMSGHDAIPKLNELCPKVSIVVLSQADDDEAILKAIRRGARGYLLKSATAGQIINAVYEVMEGGRPLSAQVSSCVLDHLTDASAPENKYEVAITERELQVLELVAEGHVKKQIAAELGISETTVIYHSKRIYVKLDADNAPAAVAKAFRLGILPR